jgi:type II secretory pathway component PulF
MLLASGVPILQSMDIVAELLPAAERGRMESARRSMKDAVPPRPALEGVDILPPFVLELIEVGTLSGSLDTTLYAAAETVEHELGCRYPS